MKRFILMAAAAALLAIPAAEAQKVNKEATLSKLEKSDADIANPKKNAKAATWINRGRVYYDAAAEPTANLFAPMETTLLKLSVGDPTSTEEVTLNGSKAIAWNYPYFIAYERDGKIVAWKQLQEIKEGALDTAIEAYNKAYELDPKQASKIRSPITPRFWAMSRSKRANTLRAPRPIWPPTRRSSAPLSARPIRRSSTMPAIC